MGLSKRVAPIEDFGDLVFTQKQKKPEDKTTVLSYNMSFEYVKKYNASGQIIKIIESWIEKLDNNISLTINDETLELCKPYIETTLFIDGIHKPVFDEELATQFGGDNGNKLAGFCKAVGIYMDAVKTVIPKQNRVIKKKAELEEAQRLLKIQTDRLDDVRRKKEALEESVNEERKNKEEQEEKADQMKKQVDNATNLITSLSGERTRWIEDSKMFQQNKMELLGNAAIAAAFVAYAGP